jgi:hypothetical protein
MIDLIAAVLPSLTTVERQTLLETPDVKARLKTLVESLTKETEVLELGSKIHSQIQKVILEDLPAIPLWYNGMWSQYNTSVWTSFPAAGTRSQFTPTVWNGYLNMTGIDALASLKLKKT